MISTLLCQAMMQAPPQVIYVHEVASGMPEWVKILISAAVGALFAIVGSIAMEFIKPAITHRHTLRKVRASLYAEFLANLANAEAAQRLMERVLETTDEERLDILSYISKINDLIKRDRYEFYFASEKEAVYQVDKNLRLDRFYEALDANLAIYLQQRRYFDVLGRVARAVRMGRLIVKEESLEYQPGENPIEGVYKDITRAEREGVEAGKAAARNQN